MTDIDFGYLQNYSINGVYKMPAGYKADAFPKKKCNDEMPDKECQFQRLL